MNKTAGKIEVPSLYDISGSANFYNKTDYGITVHRKTDGNNIMINEVDVYFQKIKYKHLGEQGILTLKYNYTNGRFQENGYDHTNWLIPDQKQDKIITQGYFNYELNEREDEAPF
jgi:twinkle protein